MSEWAPLEYFLTDVGRLADFMFMQSLDEGGVRIFSYKHRNTRRYLNLDMQGNCYTCCGKGDIKYLQVTPQEALAYVFS